MKVLIAPCSYKGTIGCNQIASAMACGLKLAMPGASTDMCPIADGGDGTLDALHTAIGGRMHFVTVDGPMSELVEAPWLKLGNMAIVELASASGLALLKGRLNAIDAHTQGLGQVIAAAAQDSDIAEIVICLGGSASTDGGAGLLTALGAKFSKADGTEIKLGALELGLISSCAQIWLPSLSNLKISVAVDVKNPLLGPDGAAYVYAPQKGATEAMVAQLDAALAHYADHLEKITMRSVRHLPGAGAAGGTAFGIACLLGAEIISGFDWISSLIQLDKRVQSADVVVTGEGRLDGQTLSGKAIGQLASLCKKHGKPLYVLPASCTQQDDWKAVGVTRVLPVVQNGQLATVNDVVKTMRLLFSEMQM
jgi:glycerate 2-kinase